ncbi:MAG: SRPBCC domain-containing protein, partial [Gemmatimonadota bacterium]|nr:SRPBCC domain-containing protein [Gemmatimonadota bacterium]
MDLKFQVYGKIARPVAEVFDAVHNPKKLSGYFTTGGASGPLDEGTTVTWDFADFPGAFPVHVRKVERNKLIEFEWQAADGAYNTQVRMEFEALDSDSTLVRIGESGWKETPKGLESSYNNCMG